MNFEDNHSRLETPVPIPNTEVKLPALMESSAPQGAKPLSCLLILIEFQKRRFYKQKELFLYMSKKISKKDVEKEIDIFFRGINNKNSKEMKKIKKLAMRHNIKLKEKRKKFCKKCLSPYVSSKINILPGKKKIKCKNCGYVSVWKLKN